MPDDLNMYAERSGQQPSLLQPLCDIEDGNASQLLSSRRIFLTSTMAAATVLAASISPVNAAASTAVPTPPFTRDLSWPVGKAAFSLLPLAGTSTRRATVAATVVPGKIWTHDQLQGIVNVNVPVRQTVIKLSPQAGGGLWVHNPVAPTPQLLEMMRQLEREHGPIRHIVLGTLALEHKATFGAFCRQFPQATVWIQPGQWSFPFNLPINFFGVPQGGAKLRELPNAGSPKRGLPEWITDIEYESLGPLKFQSVGAFGETAFYHKSTKHLIVTDTVASVTETPPEIIQEDPRALLYHARDNITEVVQDTPETRRKGWRRMVQFGLVFFPSQIQVTPFAEAIEEASHVDVTMRNLGDGAVPGGTLYPWSWPSHDADVRNFEAISQRGSLFCPPILTKLILDREPQRTLDWVDKVCSRFDFDHVIPSHLNNNVPASPATFRKAFQVLRSTPNNPQPQRPLAEDLALLQSASDELTRLGIVAPSQVCDGEPARRIGRFAS